MNSKILLVFVSVACAINARAALIPIGQNSTYFQNFDFPAALAKSGTQNTMLPRGWVFLENGKGHDNFYAANNGTSDAGNVYSYGENGSNDRALGTLRGQGFTPYIGAGFVNTSGGAVNRLDISYTGEEWRLGTAGRLDRLDFQYSLDATSLKSGTWIDANALDFVTPNTVGIGAHNGNAPNNRADISASISFLNIPAGATFWIRWTDFDASGNDDGLAVDNFSLVAVPEPGTVIAAVASIGILVWFFAKRSRRLGPLSRA